ncbi:MAG: hypothetical protein QXY56_06095 [Saccharolobus sp.]
MVHQYAILALLLLLTLVQLSPHQYFVYNVQVIYNNELYVYTYNYSIISISPLTYNLTILGLNGTIIFNKIYTTFNYSLFPPEIFINGSQIHNLSLISSYIENNTNISSYIGYISLNGQTIQLNLIYHNNILYQANGSSKNVQVNIFLVNSENEVHPTFFSYLPLIILLVVIIIAVIILIRIGKI